MYVQMFPVYGFMLGINYWNSEMSDNDIGEEGEHLIQLMIGIVGISFHFWKD